MNEEIVNLAEKIQIDSHNHVSLSMKESDGKFTYQDAMNVYLFLQLATLMHEINLLKKKKSNKPLVCGPTTPKKYKKRS